MLIIGMEGFRTDGMTIWPLPEFGADFSTLADGFEDRGEVGSR
jgi:hypothetical protein